MSESVELLCVCLRLSVCLNGREMQHYRLENGNSVKQAAVQCNSLRIASSFSHQLGTYLAQPAVARTDSRVDRAVIQRPIVALPAPLSFDSSSSSSPRPTPHSLVMSRARSIPLAADSTAASRALFLNPSNSYKRQKIAPASSFPVSNHHSDNEPVRPFHPPTAACLSPKRQMLQAKVRRLKQSQQRSERREATEADRSHRHGRSHDRRPQHESTAASSQPATQQTVGVRPSASAQPQPPRTGNPPPQQQRVNSQSRTSVADGGRGTPAVRNQPRPGGGTTPRPSTATSPQPPSYSAAMPPQTASHSHSHSGSRAHPRSLSPASDSTVPFYSSSPSPLSPQRLLSEWLDRRVALQRQKEAKAEHRWKATMQRQIEQLLQHTTAMQQAGWSRQQSVDEQERAREERVARLESGLQRLLDSRESAQQHRQQQASEQRHRVLRRAKQLSGSGGRSEVRRSLAFSKGKDGYDTVGASRTKEEESEASEECRDGWVRNESQLLWLLQHTHTQL